MKALTVWRSGSPCWRLAGSSMKPATGPKGLSLFMRLNGRYVESLMRWPLTAGMGDHAGLL